MNPKKKNLSIRMKGEDVRLLQKNLNQLGYSIEDKDGFFGKTTRRAVLELQKKHGIKATGIVDERTAGIIAAELEVRKQEGEERSKHFVVRGQIRAADGRPIAGVMVRAFDKDMRGDTKLLGEATTGADGSYQVSYTRDQLLSPEKGHAVLDVRVLGKDGAELAARTPALQSPP